MAGNGTKTVRVSYKDGEGNIGTASRTIVLDSAPPSGGVLTATAGDGQVALSWTGITDANSGLASYKLVGGTTAPATSCTTGTVLYAGTATSLIHSGLTNGTTYSYRVCGIDVAGNTGLGVAATGRPLPEFTPPTGSVVIADGAAYSKTVSVTLAIAATDTSGVSQMCVSNVAACTTWVPFATSKAWTLASTSGAKTVYVRFRDTWLNESTVAVTDGILLDSTLPAGGTLTATPSASQVALSWTAATDAHSGIAGYKLVVGATAPAASCTTGTVAYAGAATAYVFPATNGTTYNFRLCAIDNAGNVAAGLAATARPAPEYDGPTGSLVIAAGAEVTRVLAVTLAIAGADSSGVSQMCVSNAATCTAWEPYATTKAWTLTANSATKTVYLKLRDLYGNESAALTDTIVLDVTAPTSGLLSANASSGQISLSWTAATDAHSGVAGYRLVVGAVAPAASCTTGTPIYSGTGSSYVYPATNGTTYLFRLCAVDNAGNVAAGVAITAVPAPEYVAPTGSVVINRGAALTKVVTVELTLAASDASGVSQVCISNTTAACTTWQEFATTKTFALSSANGVKTVYVYFRDIYNNTSAAVTDQITLDTVKPVNGVVTPTAGAAAVGLSWTGFSDLTTGIASYTVVVATATTATAAPTTCTTGTVVYSGTATSASHTGLNPELTYYYRVCATDVAGNLSTGTATSMRPTP